MASSNRKVKKMSDKLIIKKPLFNVIKLKIFFFMYRIYNSIKDHFALLESRDYNFQGDRLNQEQIDKRNNYGETVIPKYITAQPKEEIEGSSEKICSHFFTLLHLNNLPLVISPDMVYGG